jgi:hypothetical protein
MVCDELFPFAHSRPTTSLLRYRALGNNELEGLHPFRERSIVRLSSDTTDSLWIDLAAGMA